MNLWFWEAVYSCYTKLMLKWFKRIFLTIGLLVLVVSVYHYFVNKNAYTNLPENGKPGLELPIDKSGKIPNTIMPMGETINHDIKQGGTPGLISNGKMETMLRSTPQWIRK